MGSLSVRENLQFSAALRLPGHMTASDRKQRVEKVIETLNLFSCADTKVGNNNFANIMADQVMHNHSTYKVKCMCILSWYACMYRVCSYVQAYLHLVMWFVHNMSL